MLYSEICSSKASPRLRSQGHGAGFQKLVGQGEEMLRSEILGWWTEVTPSAVLIGGIARSRGIESLHNRTPYSLLSPSESCI